MLHNIAQSGFPVKDEGKQDTKCLDHMGIS